MMWIRPRMIEAIYSWPDGKGVSINDPVNMARVETFEKEDSIVEDQRHWHFKIIFHFSKTTTVWYFGTKEARDNAYIDIARVIDIKTLWKQEQ